MKTRVVRLNDGRWVITYKRHFWSEWDYVALRFLTKKNAEDYARRFKWKTLHPGRYRKMLEKYEKEKFTGSR